jgi:hypothetical protein
MVNPLHQSSLALPLLDSLHLLGILLGLGPIVLLNLRLLGVSLTGSSPSSLWRETLFWTLGGLMLAIFSGFLLFSIDPELYLDNQIFRAKITVLIAAIAFYSTLVRRAALRDRPSIFIAGISLLLFALVPLGGVLLGYEWAGL